MNPSLHEATSCSWTCRWIIFTCCVTQKMPTIRRICKFCWSVLKNVTQTGKKSFLRPQSPQKTVTLITAVSLLLCLSLHGGQLILEVARSRLPDPDSSPHTHTQPRFWVTSLRLVQLNITHNTDVPAMNAHARARLIPMMQQLSLTHVCGHRCTLREEQRNSEKKHPKRDPVSRDSTVYNNIVVFTETGWVWASQIQTLKWKECNQSKIKGPVLCKMNSQ